MERASEQWDGFGISFAEHLDHELQSAMEAAKPRTRVTWGKPLGYDALELQILLKDLSANQIDTSIVPSPEVARAALLLRDIVEWNGWSRDTAFPGVQASASTGEPLGQCLVTSRFAKDYFRGARLAEVRVRNVAGEIVGPHVILTVPSGQSGEMALDLTPDQAYAVGHLSLAVRTMLPHFKINYVPLNDPRNPYQIVRYQTDDQLATKRSRPLDHTRLLKEKIAFATGHPLARSLEGYADRTHSSDLPQLQGIGSYLWGLLRCHITEELSINLNDFEVQAGTIRPKDFQPSPAWLWQTAGLTGFRKAMIYDRGFAQQFLVLNGDSIQILNLAGSKPPPKVLEAAQWMVERESTRVLTGKQLIKEHIEAKGWSGPIYVQL